MSLFDLSSYVSDFKNCTVSINRPQASTFTNGKADPRSYASIEPDLDGNFQPIAGKDLVHLSEGDLATEWGTLYVVGELKVGDRLGLNGIAGIPTAAFEVRKVLDWRPNGNFTKVLVKAGHPDES